MQGHGLVEFSVQAGATVKENKGLKEAERSELANVHGTNLLFNMFLYNVYMSEDCIHA